MNQSTTSRAVAAITTRSRTPDGQLRNIDVWTRGTTPNSQSPDTSPATSPKHAAITSDTRTSGRGTNCSCSVRCR